MQSFSGGMEQRKRGYNLEQIQGLLTKFRPITQTVGIYAEPSLALLVFATLLSAIQVISPLFLHCPNKAWPFFTHSIQTPQHAAELTRLRRVDGNLVGICTNAMFATGSQLESVGWERLEVLQQVGGCRLKAYFLLKGEHDDVGTWTSVTSDFVNVNSQNRNSIERHSQKHAL